MGPQKHENVHFGASFQRPFHKMHRVLLAFGSELTSKSAENQPLFAQISTTRALRWDAIRHVQSLLRENAADSLQIHCFRTRDFAGISKGPVEIENVHARLERALLFIIVEVIHSYVTHIFTFTPTGQRPHQSAHRKMMSIKLPVSAFFVADKHSESLRISAGSQKTSHDGEGAILAG